MGTEFEDLLERTTQVRKQKVTIEEHADALANMIAIKLNGVLGQHQKEFMSLDESMRERIKESLRSRLEEIFKNVEDYPKKGIL